MERRELRAQIDGHHLGQSLRGEQVLEAVLAEIAQLEGAIGTGAAECADRVRDHDLAAIGHRGDPRRAIDVVADDVPGHLHRLAGMQAHPDEDFDSVRPRLARERALPFDGGVDRGPGALEQHEERVALRALLGSAVRRKRGAQQLAMALPDGRVARGAERKLEPRGALDVGEQERDDARHGTADVCHGRVTSSATLSADARR
jgi:hypothetical protein